MNQIIIIKKTKLNKECVYIYRYKKIIRSPSKIIEKKNKKKPKNKFIINSFHSIFD